MNDPMDPLNLPTVDRPDHTKPAPGSYVILVGVQFDQTGVHALHYALDLATSHARPVLHIAHIVADTDTSSRAKVVDRHVKELEEEPQHLRDFVRVNSGDAKIPAHLHVRIGQPAPTLLQLALDYDADVIVVGTHGRKGLKKLVFGSVAQELVAAARLPIVMATPQDFSGMERTPIPDPVCPDCVKAREDSDGQLLWCEHHARRHVHGHTFGSTEAFHIGRNSPSIIP